MAVFRNRSLYPDLPHSRDTALTGSAIPRIAFVREPGLVNCVGHYRISEVSRTCPVIYSRRIKLRKLITRAVSQGHSARADSATSDSQFSEPIFSPFFFFCDVTRIYLRPSFRSRCYPNISLYTFSLPRIS